MTAPTPSLEARLRALSVRATDGGMYEANETLLVTDMAAALIEAADALAAATADRGDARRKLAEQKRINASNLRVMTEQLELARQKIADAPHAWPCATIGPGSAVCDCWKAGL